MDVKALITDRSWLFGLTGKLAVYAFPYLGVLGAFGLVLLGMDEYLILSSYLILPIIVTPLVYLWVNKRVERATDSPQDDFSYLLAGYLLLFAFSVLLLYAFAVRPVVYYIAVAAMATIVFVEVLRARLTPGRTGVILLQIMAMMLNVFWGVTLKYFRFVGRTDMLVHAYYADSLVQLGHITTIFYDYQPFPLWHILSAAITLATGGEYPVYRVMAIAGALAFILVPAVIYLIGVKLFREERTALVAALIMSFFPDLIIMGTSTIARVIAEILMVFMLYLLLSGKGRVKYVLILPIMAAIITYHSISIIFVTLILAAFYVLQALFIKKEERFISLWLIVLTIAMAFGYWLLNAPALIRRLIGNATASTGTIGVPAELTKIQPWNELFNYLQYLPSLFFILAGAFLLLLTKKYSARARILAFTALLFVWVSYPGPVEMLGQVAINLGIDRFSEYTFALLIPVAAVGVVGLYARSGRAGRAVLVGLFALWVLFAVSNDWVASDNPLVKRPFYNFYFSEQEIAGMDRLVTHVTGILESDYVPNRYYESSPYVLNTTLFEVDVPNMTFVRSGTDDVLLIRDGEHQDRELRGAVLPDDVFVPKPEADSFTYIDRNLSVWKTLPLYNRVYDSQAISAYI